MDNNKVWVKAFDKCPACGSTERFFESIVNELKAEGKVEKDWIFSLDAKAGPVANPQKLALAPSGTEFPAYSFRSDICVNCGLIYVVNLERGTGKKAAPLIMPNRAERRAMGNFNPLGSNNPLSS